MGERVDFAPNRMGKAVGVVLASTRDMRGLSKVKENDGPAGQEILTA